MRSAPSLIYDIAKNEGFVNVGLSSDTGTFASNSVNSMGHERYHDAKDRLITENVD